MYFWNQNQILNFLKNKMSHIAPVFPNYWLRKRRSLRSLKGPVLEQPLAINVLVGRKNTEHARQLFYPLFGSFWDKLGWKTSLLGRSEILGLLFKTLTSNDMYSLHNRLNFMKPIQMQLSKKPFFFSISRSISEVYIKF